MKFTMVLVALVVVASPVLAETVTLQVSLGTRETGFAGSAVGTVGANGGASGGIEWLDLDLQTLTLDDTWQQFSFDMDQVVATAFAGGSANGILEGDYGTIEHIRFKATSTSMAPITLWIDDIKDLVGGPVPPANFQTVSDFEGYADGTEVVFQEPTFSGSTAAKIQPGATSGIDNTVAYTGSGSLKVQWSWVSGDEANWLRLTTFSALNVPNPVIRYDQNSVVSFWIKGVPEPTSLLLLGLGGLLLRRR
jgi:hypothetical protein